MRAIEDHIRFYAIRNQGFEKRKYNAIELIVLTATSAVEAIVYIKIVGETWSVYDKFCVLKIDRCPKSSDWVDIACKSGNPHQAYINGARVPLVTKCARRSSMMNDKYSLRKWRGVGGWGWRWWLSFSLAGFIYEPGQKINVEPYSLNKRRKNYLSSRLSSKAGHFRTAHFVILFPVSFPTHGKLF